MAHTAFGWLLITLGFVSGAFLGLRFDREGWLGGYASLPRRMVRLGHIALIALGALNVLFDFSLYENGYSRQSLLIGSWGLYMGAVAMPACCFLMAWRTKAKPLFVVPVASLIAAGVNIVAEALRT